MPDATLDDPRHSPDFRPEFYPLCDGSPAPAPQSEHPVESRMIEFAHVYYRLNLLYDRLRKIRVMESTEDAPSVLLEIAELIRVRDALEDRLAPEGFYAEPLIDGLIAKNLVFSHALKYAASPTPTESTSSFSLFVPMPPPGENLKDHLRRHLAPLFDPSSGIQRSDRKKSRPMKQKAAVKPTRPQPAAGVQPGSRIAKKPGKRS